MDNQDISHGGGYTPRSGKPPPTAGEDQAELNKNQESDLLIAQKVDGTSDNATVGAMAPVLKAPQAP